jgi:hypothetical protein
MVNSNYQIIKTGSACNTSPPLTLTETETELTVMATSQLSLFSEESQESRPKKKKSAQRSFNRLGGQRFGRLVIKKYAGADKRNKTLWLCECDCGNQVVVQQSNLGVSTLSCGCLNKDNVVGRYKRTEFNPGQVFGLWEVVRAEGKEKSGNKNYLCRCACGTEKHIAGYNLKLGRSTNCGCAAKRQREIAKKIKHQEVIKRKPIDMKQMAKDLYCWYLDGWTLKRIAVHNGWGNGTSVSELFTAHVSEYLKNKKHKKNGQPRSHNMGYMTESEYKSKSKKFKSEAAFQKHCVEILKKNKHRIEQFCKKTGYEIDIKTEQYRIEVKAGTAKNSMYCALGQLLFNASLSTLKPILLIPSDTEVIDNMGEVFNRHEIKIITELDLNNL